MKKRCQLDVALYRKLTDFVGLHNNSPTPHQISYWVNISFRIGVSCIEQNLVNMNEILLQPSAETEENCYISIETKTYEELKIFVASRNRKAGVHVLNYWLNIACEVGLSSILSKRVDLASFFLGESSQQWLNPKNNLTLIPSAREPQAEIKGKPEIKQPEPSKEERKRSPNYDPDEMEAFMRSLENAS